MGLIQANRRKEVGCAQVIQIDRSALDRCMGCGVCVSHCPEGALSLRREPSRGIPLELDELLTGRPGFPAR